MGSKNQPAAFVCSSNTKRCTICTYIHTSKQTCVVANYIHTHYPLFCVPHAGKNNTNETEIVVRYSWSRFRSGAQGGPRVYCLWGEGRCAIAAVAREAVTPFYFLNKSRPLHSSCSVCGASCSGWLGKQEGACAQQRWWWSLSAWSWQQPVPHQGRMAAKGSTARRQKN